jgi:hypothetical protein
VERLIWGRGVFYDPSQGRYRFDYRPHKTSGNLKITFEPNFGRFFDALLLGDVDPRYLGALRDRALRDHRPLFVRYDGAPVAYGWIGRVWETAVGSGSHLARTILQTFLADRGEEALRYGPRALGHRSIRRTETYRDDKARQRAANRAAADSCAAEIGGEITDLI